MSPTQRATKAKRPASRAKRKPAARRAAKPAAPAPWTADIRDVNVVAYNVSDLERAKKFYGETLGLPVALALNEAGWVEYGRPHQAHLGINLWRGPDPMPPTSGGGHATLTCDDVRGTIERLRAKGIRCDEVQEIPGMVILGNFYDPDGNLIQLAETLMPVG